jgi:hypothetical protein
MELHYHGIFLGSSCFDFVFGPQSPFTSIATSSPASPALNHGAFHGFLVDIHINSILSLIANCLHHPLNLGQSWGELFFLILAS